MNISHKASAPKLVPLIDWAKARYSKPPSIHTLRRWAREDRIVPFPRLDGRSYFVVENARYIDPRNPNYAQAVAEQMHESTETQ